MDSYYVTEGKNNRYSRHINRRLEEYKQRHLRYLEGRKHGIQ